MRISITITAIYATICLWHEADGFTLGNVSLDPAVIYTGLFDPNNVLVHIMQNVFNVIASTLFWIAALLIIGPSVGGRDSGGRRLFQRVHGAPDVDGINRVAGVLRGVADGAEQIGR